MTLLAPDAKPRWRSFLEDAVSDEVQRIVSGQTNHLELKFHQIQAFDPDFADILLLQPDHILREGSNALRTYCMEMGSQQQNDPFIRVSNLPLDSRRVLRSVGHADVQKLISSEVIATKVSEIKPRIHRAVFQCSCDYETEIMQRDHTELEEPLQCGGCGERKGRVKFTLVKEKCSLVDNQKIEIQEIPERVPSGAQPSSGMVILEGDLVNRVLPGTRIIANMVPQMHSERKGARKTPLFEIFYNMVSMETETEPFTEINIDQEDIEKILKLVNDHPEPELLKLVTSSIAPSIFATPGLYQVKRSLALQLFGGVSRISPDGTRTRGDIHILLMGDPGVAKSQLLTYMSNLSPRGKFASGGSVTSAGLTAAAVKDGFSDGRFALEAGVLPLSDRGLAAIDEFDKIGKQERSAIHPAMEQQKVRVAKGGITATLNSRCAVLAAANPKSGRFEYRGGNASIMQSFAETDLEAPLASRFDLIWLLSDIPDRGLDERIATHIIRNRASGSSELQIEDQMGSIVNIESEEMTETGLDDNDHLTTGFLRKYIAYAKKNIHPTIDTEAQSEIVKYYIQTRQNYQKGMINPASSDYSLNSTKGENQTEISVTARALEALMRLTEAHARMHLREVATITDAKMAISIFKHWREESNIRDEAELQTGISKAGQSSIVKQIMREISVENDGKMPISKILDRAMLNGVDEATVRTLVSKMQQNGIIYQPPNTPGTYEFV